MEESGRLFFALMYKDKEILKEALKELEMEFGNAFFKIKDYEFNFTDYYEKEFGRDLKKTIFIFDTRVNKEDLVEIKILCSQIESNFSDDNGKRTIDTDPGYFNKKEVILASFKGKDFKEYLEEDVFAHKILEFDGNKIKDFFHTFEDFKSKHVQDFFLNIVRLE